MIFSRLKYQYKESLPQTLVALVLSASLFVACSTTNNTSNSDQNTGGAISSSEAGVFNNLGDYLRRVPGLQYTDGYFRIRGPQSLGQTDEPLYVIDGVIIGNSYDRANGLIDPLNIDRVNVLKDIGSSNKYGMRGANGVIEIFTKKG